jgi:hypothetical protein
LQPLVPDQGRQLFTKFIAYRARQRLLYITLHDQVGLLQFRQACSSTELKPPYDITASKPKIDRAINISSRVNPRAAVGVLLISLAA